MRRGAGAALLLLLASTLGAQPAAALSRPFGPAVPPAFGLSEFIRHWEPAQYEPSGSADGRVRRDASESGFVRLNFKAHDREFRLKLRPDPNSVFAEDAEFHSTTGPVEFHTDNVYTGTLEDDDNSSVHGIITSDGLFDGTIHTLHETFYIEPLRRYDKSHSKIHSAIYKTSDVIHPSHNSSLPCASHQLHMVRRHKSSVKHQEDLVENYFPTHQGTIVKYISDYDSDIDSLLRHKREKRWLPSDDEVALSPDLDDDDDEITPLRNPSLPIDLFVPYYSETEDSNLEILLNKIKNTTDKTRGILISSYDDENDGDTLSRPNSKNHIEVRTKVNVQNDIVDKKPVGFTIISSLLGNVSDSALRHVNKRATIDPKKTTCMLYLQADHQFYQKFGSEEACIEVMTRHVQRVNAIYRVTDFNLDGKPDNITFMIKRIKVHTSDALKDPLYRFPSNYGVEKFLELFSEEDYDGFCLAYMFTYRDFEMGTLGLAWTGDLKNAGGVCEKNGHYRGSLKSLNTGIVTLLNYGKHVPPAVSHVTLAHEIGHNFGSPHDPEVCTPGGEDGNFIMFARATSGDKKNNNHFSPCSLKSINPVLNNKARSSKGCFTEPQVSLCGNGVVEEGEECDCGWEGDCREPCCHPQRRHPPPGETPCKLTPHSVCSPSQGPCCTAQCSLRFGNECRTDNGCRDSAHCDGRRPFCPPSISKPNRTVCDDGFVCYMGECTGSICLAYGLESCQCSSERACDLCCRMPGPGNPCRSSFLWNNPPYDVPDMFAKPGTPCNEYNGYCDVFQKCREVDPSGPLATLRKLLLSEESLSSFKKWIWDHWYAVVLIILMVFALLIGSTKLLGKRSDGKLKTVTIIHSSTTETVRLPENSEGVIVHTAVRSKVPLKKKVALKSRSHRKKKDKSREADKNKKRTSPVANGDPNKEASNKHVEAIAIKLRKSGGKHKTIIAKRKGKLNKEVIDYSATQKDAEPNGSATVPMVAEADSVGKVQSWLLNTPQQGVIIKSKSTPVGLTDRAYASGHKGVNAASKAIKSKHDKNKSVSANNLIQGDNDKFRLQVTYKPPFKFSVKLCKGDKNKVVLDKMKHLRHEHIKKKSGRTSKPEDRTSKQTMVPGVISANDLHVQASQITQSSSGATAGLSHDLSSNHYEQVGMNERLNISGDAKPEQNQRTESKRTHKKSSSLSHGSNLHESRQNLLDQSIHNSPNMHFYENVVANANLNEVVNRINKTSSMPRNSPLKNPNRAIFRQSSHNPSSRSRTNQQSSSSNSRHLQKSLSNASQHGSSNHLHKGSSLNNLHLDSKRNSIAQKKRSSMAAEQVYSNVDYIDRAEEKQKKLLKLSGFDARNNLKRQMSATELHKSSQPGEFLMPMSAGANFAHRPEFEWIQGGKKGNISERPTCSNDSRISQDCLESQIVPNLNDNQMLLERNVDHLKKMSTSKALPLSNSALRRQQIPQDNSVACNFPENFQGTSGQWPMKFGELKHSLPNASNVSDAGVYQSDMEVVVSDNDYSLYDA